MVLIAKLSSWSSWWFLWRGGLAVHKENLRRELVSSAPIGVCGVVDHFVKQDHHVGVCHVFCPAPPPGTPCGLI